jgi:hypothetical protein
MAICPTAALVPPFSMSDDATYTAKNCPPTSLFLSRGMSVSIESVVVGIHLLEIAGRVCLNHLREIVVPANHRDFAVMDHALTDGKA